MPHRAARGFDCSVQGNTQRYAREFPTGVRAMKSGLKSHDQATPYAGLLWQGMLCVLLKTVLRTPTGLFPVAVRVMH